MAAISGMWRLERVHNDPPKLGLSLFYVLGFLGDFIKMQVLNQEVGEDEILHF